MFSDHHEIKLETATERWMKNVWVLTRTGLLNSLQFLKPTDFLSPVNLHTHWPLCLKCSQSPFSLSLLNIFYKSISQESVYELKVILKALNNYDLSTGTCWQGQRRHHCDRIIEGLQSSEVNPSAAELRQGVGGMSLEKNLSIQSVRGWNFFLNLFYYFCIISV